MVGKLYKADNEEWKENFRMSKPNFMKLCNLLRPYIEKETTRFTKPLTVETQVAITLYYIADEGRMQKVANAFDSIVLFILVMACDISVSDFSIPTSIFRFKPKSSLVQFNIWVSQFSFFCHFSILSYIL